MSGRWGAVPLEDALTVLWGCVASGRGFLPLRWWHETEGRQEHDVSSPRRFRGLIQHLGVEHELSIPACCRHERARGAAAGEIFSVWVRCESGESGERLGRFRPAPTIVLREGGTARRTAFWAVTRRHTVEQALRANRRLAHSLRAPKKHGSPDDFWFAPCGTFLRDGRARPVPVVVESCTGAVYRPREVYGWLRDAPDPDAWRNREAA